MLRTRFWPITARPISPMSQLAESISSTVADAVGQPFLAAAAFPGGVLLGENLGHDIARDPGEPRVQPLELHREPLVIDPQQVEHGRMEIRHRDRILFRRVAQLVGSPVANAALDAAAREHKRESLDVMIATIT